MSGAVISANPIKPSGEFEPLVEEDEMVVGFQKCRICSTYYDGRNDEEESQHLAWHHERLFRLTVPSNTYFYDIGEVIKCLARMKFNKTKIEEKVRQLGILSYPKDLRGYSCDICKRLDTSDENIFLSHMKNVCLVTKKERMDHIVNFCRGCQGRFPSREMLEAHIAAGPCWPPMTVIDRLYDEVKHEGRHNTGDIIEMSVKRESDSVIGRVSAGREQEEMSLSSLTPKPRLPCHTKTLQHHHLTELAPPPLSHSELPRPVPAWNPLSQILPPVPHLSQPPPTFQSSVPQFSQPPPTIQPSVPQSSQSRTTFKPIVPQLPHQSLTVQPSVPQYSQSRTTFQQSVPQSSQSGTTFQPSVPQSSQSRTTFQSSVPQSSQAPVTKQSNNVLRIHQSPSICPGSPPPRKRLASHSEPEPSPAFSPISRRRKKSQFAPPLPERPLPSASNLFSSPEKRVRERFLSPEEIELTTQSPPEEEVRVLSQIPAQSQDSKLLRLSIAKTIQKQLWARGKQVSELELNSLVDAEYQRVLHKIPRPSNRPSAPAPVPSYLSTTGELPPTRERRKTLRDPRLSRQNYADGSHEVRRIRRLPRRTIPTPQHSDSDIECLDC